MFYVDPVRAERSSVTSCGALDRRLARTRSITYGTSEVIFFAVSVG